MSELQQLDLSTDKFILTVVGLEVKGKPDFEDWMDYGITLKALDGTSRQFAIGDWIVHGFGAYEHGKWKAVQQIWDGEPKTLQDYEYVAKRVKSTVRTVLLSWSHHRTVAELEESKQRQWLKQAIEHKWSVAKLRKEVSGREPNVHFSSETPQWNTPDHIVKLVKEVLNEIDLDPCSSGGEEPSVSAKKHYVEEDDGLSHPWSGTVYMNPPYGKEIGNWVERLCSECELGNVEEAIALVPSRTDTQWFRRFKNYPRCFIWGRLQFNDEGASAPFPSMAVYLGKDKDRFIKVFGSIGDIYERTNKPKNDKGVQGRTQVNVQSGED